MTRILIAVAILAAVLFAVYEAGKRDGQIKELETENQILEGAGNADLSTDDPDINLERLRERARQ